jgi:chondroitin AC lyase
MISRKTLYLFILLLLTFPGCFDLKVQYPEELQQLHRNVWDYFMDEGIDEENIDLLLASINDRGQWPGIDYNSKTRGAWSPRDHLGNLLDISIAYQTKHSKYYHKDKVSEKIHLALNHWLENDFTSPNWWHPQIGIPLLIAPVMVLMEAELTDEQMDRGYRILERSKIGMTGQNKVWLSGNVLIRSLLKRDMDTIKLASESIEEELVISMSEGIQPDWSYHQHGPQLQFGNYGLSFVNDMIKWTSILRNTPYQFNEKKISILRNYVLNGQQWVTWKDQLDISACGRQLFVDSPASKAASLSKHFIKLETLDPVFGDAYRKANQYESLTGHKHFWRSDFQVWRCPDYYFSVKMCSERVIGAESCNSENIQGYYMGDGAAFLYQTGEEYRNIFPFLDWKKIPGTTTLQDDDPLPVLTARGYRIESDFVGGVSDGENGAAAMDYCRNGLRARKSWFMFDGKIACLGAGIWSNAGLTVTTGINQTYLNGEVTVKINDQAIGVNGKQVFISPSWILHDNIGYLFPEGGKIMLQAESTEGSWNWVAKSYPDERISADLFRLWFDHGKNPRDRSYEYILIPGADREKLENLEKKDHLEIRNDKDIQAVYSKDRTCVGIVFYKAGMFDGDPVIEVNKPCIVMVKQKPEGLQVSMADPSQLEKEIQITLNGEYEHENASVEDQKTKIAVLLPQGGDAGKTISLHLKQN